MRKNNVLKMMLCIVMLCVVSAFAASASAASSGESEQFLQLINMERAKAGVSAVTIGSQNLNDALRLVHRSSPPAILMSVPMASASSPSSASMA